MYFEKEYQKTDESIAYTGRRIRMARPEEKTVKQAITDVQQSVAKNETIAQASKVSHQQEQSVYHEQKENLLRSLERNFNNTSTNQLIGVFGINSDVVLREALEEFTQTIDRNRVIRLPKSYIVGDVYDTFAAIMYKFMTSEACRTDSCLRPLLSEMHTRRCIMTYISNICPNKDISILSNAALMSERAENCKKIVRYVNQQLQGRNVKFIWNVEIAPAEQDFSIMKELSKIASENLIIIVNFLRPLELEARMMGSGFGEQYSYEFGRELLQKYFWYEDMIVVE